MRRRRRPLDRRGLTLIELVLTLTILGIAGALVSGALTTALRTWQSGLRAGREELVARIVLERLAQQLRSAVPAPAKLDEKDAVAFDAGEDRLRFVTMAAGERPAHVFYSLREDGGGRHLVYREHPWPDKDFFGESKARRQEDVAEVTGFSVKVIKREKKAGAGADLMDTVGTPAAEQAPGAVVEGQWRPEQRELPARVELEIQVRAEGKAEPLSFAVSVPLLAEKP